MPTASTLQAENYEQKCLCVLVLDTSYSMDDGQIEELNNGLKRFQEELLKAYQEQEEDEQTEKQKADQ